MAKKEATKQAPEPSEGSFEDLMAKEREFQWELDRKKDTGHVDLRSGQKTTLGDVPGLVFDAVMIAHHTRDPHDLPEYVARIVKSALAATCDGDWTQPVSLEILPTVECCLERVKDEIRDFRVDFLRT